MLWTLQSNALDPTEQCSVSYGAMLYIPIETCSVRYRARLQLLQSIAIVEVLELMLELIIVLDVVDESLQAKLGATRSGIMTGEIPVATMIRNSVAKSLE